MTQLASTSSIENARKAIRRESKSGATRKRKRNDWSSDEEQEDTRRKIRAKKARSTRKKQSTGSDSSLTDIDDFGHQVVTEVTTVETSTIETTVEGTVEEAADIEETASALDDVVIIAESHANSSPDSMLK
ncbi:hypothetical protein OEZ81_25930, partial [Leclercia adecarboxylata]|uniref:hypothetical protein n=1 Tax=Leclercia adecarboxylata TaxID=83655 RepID=UPI00234DCD84